MSAQAYNGQGSEGRSPIEADDIFLFLNKIITEIGKILTKIFFFAGGGPKSMAKLDGGHGRVGSPGSAPAHAMIAIAVQQPLHCESYKSFSLIHI